MVITIITPISRKWKAVGNAHGQHLLPLQAVIRSVWCFEHNLATQCVVLINNYWVNETREDLQGKRLV